MGMMLSFAWCPRFVPSADVTLSLIIIAFRRSIEIKLMSVADTGCTAAGRFLHRDLLLLLKAHYDGHEVLDSLN
jgi:hypothetical protein